MNRLIKTFHEVSNFHYISDLCFIKPILEIFDEAFLIFNNPVFPHDTAILEKLQDVFVDLQLLKTYIYSYLFLIAQYYS